MFCLDELEVKYDELREKLTQLQTLATSLQVQLADAQSTVTIVRQEREQCMAAHEVEKQKLQDALNLAVQEKIKTETKWHADFEQLRTVNSGNVLWKIFKNKIYNFIFFFCLAQIEKNIYFKIVNGNYVQQNNRVKQKWLQQRLLNGKH